MWGGFSILSWFVLVVLFICFLLLEEVRKRKHSQNIKSHKTKPWQSKSQNFPSFSTVFLHLLVKGQHNNIFLSKEILMCFLKAHAWQCPIQTGDGDCDCRDAPLAWPVSVSVVSHGNGTQEAARVRGQLQRVRWGWIDRKMTVEIYWTAPPFIVGC